MRFAAQTRPSRAAGRVAVLLPLSVAAALVALGWVGSSQRLPGARATRVEPVADPARPAPAPDPEPELWIDPASLAGRIELAGVDPRWGDELGERLGDHPPFRPDDRGALEALRDDLEALSFVALAELLPPRPATDEGPGFELLLRVPVACVPVGAGFQTVDADGVLLSGIWPTPPRIGGAPLPVLGPIRDGRGVFRVARAGDWLVEPEHTDALDVALSLREHLSVAERSALGRVVIDASSARRASVREPGVRLELEGRRLILFGRAPATDEPGELAVGEKWRSVRRAVALVDRRDWELVDVRWDRPEMVARAPATAAPDDDRRIALATDDSGAPRPRAARPTGARPPVRPRVR